MPHLATYSTENSEEPIILVVLLVGALPAWPYSRSWGYWPGGLLGTVVLVLLILLLLGYV